MKPLCKENILSLLDDKTIDISVKDIIDSTNNAFEELIPSTKLSICLAETQTQGRGQLQKIWHSPSGENIYLSLCYFSSKSPTALSQLSIVIGQTLCLFLNNGFTLKAPAKIKWPNDILCDEKKISGILIEIKKVSNQQHRVVIGIGINVNMHEVPESAISQPWTSLAHMTGSTHDRNLICAHLINKIQIALRLFEENKVNVS